MLKIVVGIITGSVAILSEAIHSFLDLIAAFIAFISVRISKSRLIQGIRTVMEKSRICRGLSRRF